jgi:hypothetical protein
LHPSEGNLKGIQDLILAVSKLSVEILAQVVTIFGDGPYKKMLYLI